MTLVSLLILFRSLDGSSPLVDKLRRYLPFVPFPPSLERRNGTSIGSISTNPGGPPRHHYNENKTLVVAEQRVFENKIIVEEDEGEAEASTSRSSNEGASDNEKGYSYNASSTASTSSGSRSRGEKTVSRVPVPILEIRSPSSTCYSPPPPEYRRDSVPESVEMEDDDSAVDKDGGNRS